MFSPQVRGWSCSFGFDILDQSVFPAGAGVILPLFIEASAISGFPRRCGGDPNAFYNCKSFF